MTPTRVVRDLAQLLTMNDDGPLGQVIPDGAIAFDGGRVVWIGPSKEAPACADTRSLPDVWACQGWWTAIPMRCGRQPIGRISTASGRGGLF